jgi:YD repeat-containing protein
MSKKQHLSKHDSSIVHRAVYDGQERLGSVEERDGQYVAHNRRNAEIGTFNSVAAAATAVWLDARGQS